MNGIAKSVAHFDLTRCQERHNLVKSHTLNDRYDFLTLPPRHDGAVALKDLKAASGKMNDALCDYTHLPDISLSFDLNQFLLIRTTALISKSSLVQSLCDSAIKSGWHIMLSDLEGQDYCIDVPEQTLTLSSHGLGARSLCQSRYFSNVTCLSLIRGLREIWHEERLETLSDPDQYQPQDIILLERFRSADCEATLTLALWEIERTGNSALWRHFVGSNEGDIALSFAHFIGANSFKKDFHLHEAMRIVFNQWFSAQDRVNQCDHNTLEYLDSMLDLHHDQPKSAFGDKIFDYNILIKLSTLPGSSAYLDLQSAQAMAQDSFYSAITDMINKSHLEQIIQDLTTVQVAGVAFRSSALAMKIFPDGGDFVKKR